MKTLILILFTAILTRAQSSFYIMKPVFIQEPEGEVKVSGVSLKNTWIGSKLSYEFQGDGLLKQNFLFSAKILYTPIHGDRYAIPIVSGLGVNSPSPFSPDGGINIGVYPYYVVKDATNSVLVLHGGLGYKMIPKEMPEDALRTFVRASIGMEVLMYQNGFKAPLSLSITPLYMDGMGLEITGILPISAGIGILAEYFAGTNSVFRLGIINQ